MIQDAGGLKAPSKGEAGDKSLLYGRYHDILIVNPKSEVHFPLAVVDGGSCNWLLHDGGLVARKEGSFSLPLTSFSLSSLYLSDQEQAQLTRCFTAGSAAEPGQWTFQGTRGFLLPVKTGNTACNHSFCASSFTVSWMYK